MASCGASARTSSWAVSRTALFGNAILPFRASTTMDLVAIVASPGVLMSSRATVVTMLSLITVSWATTSFASVGGGWRSIVFELTEHYRVALVLFDENPKSQKESVVDRYDHSS